MQAVAARRCWPVKNCAWSFGGEGGFGVGEGASGGGYSGSGWDVGALIEGDFFHGGEEQENVGFLRAVTH